VVGRRIRATHTPNNEKAAKATTGYRRSLTTASPRLHPPTPPSSPPLSYRIATSRVRLQSPPRMVLAGIFLADAGAGAPGAIAIVRDGTDGSPLLGRLLQELRYLFAAEVLSLLDPMDLALLARACWKCGEAALSSDVDIAGETEGESLRLTNFVGSVKLLAWGKDNWCPWNERTCALVAAGGNLAVLQWAREHGCEWDTRTCAYAAGGGHLAVLVWAREQDCPWGEGNAV